MPPSSFAKNMKGVAGVHLVTAQLSLRGYVALPTTRNLKSVDVVAFNENLTQHAFIQVKSTDKPKGGWPVHTSHDEQNWEEEIRAIGLGDHFFYVFGSLPTPSQDQPAFYVAPSKDVAAMIIEDMKRWLSGAPERRAGHQLLAWAYGQREPEKLEKYLSKWESLKLGES